jgi:hypothetical protein
MTLKKDKSTEENRAFWRSVETASKTVAEWPAWKRCAEPTMTLSTTASTPSAEKKS